MEPSDRKTGPIDPISYTMIVYGCLNTFLAILDFFDSCAPPWQPLEVGQSRDFAILEVFLYISKMPKSQKNSTWSPCVGGLPKIENFKICQNLLIWTKTNIESNFGGYQASTGYQRKNFSRFYCENAIFPIPSIFSAHVQGNGRNCKNCIFTVKTAEIFLLVPRTGLITPNVTFYISFDPSKQVLTDFEIFDFW